MFLHGVKWFFCVGWLMAVFCGTAVLAADKEPATLDDLMRSAEDWGQESLDPEVLEAFQSGDRQKIERLFRDLQSRFQGEYVIDMAALKAGVQTVLHLPAKVNEQVGLKLLDLDPMEHPVIREVMSGSAAEADHGSYGLTWERIRHQREQIRRPPLVRGGCDTDDRDCQPELARISCKRDRQHGKAQASIRADRRRVGATKLPLSIALKCRAHGQSVRIAMEIAPMKSPWVTD